MVGRDQVKHCVTFIATSFLIVFLSMDSMSSHAAEPQDGEKKPWIIAHRGASAYRPEHTLAAYELAIEQGADFIEVDLVLTRDGVLISRHENELSETTDVAEQTIFADRKTDKRIDGELVTGWFSEDFTLAEIKQLNAKERIPAIRPGNRQYEQNLKIPTLEEVVSLLKSEEMRSGKQIKLIPELKHPTYFLKEGRYLDGTVIKASLGQLLVDKLVTLNFVQKERVYIQSFEVESLLDLKYTIMPGANVEFPLVQLLGDTQSSQGSFSQPYDMVYNSLNGLDIGTIYHGLDEVIKGGINERIRYERLVTDEVFTFMADRYASAISPWKANLYQLKRLNQAIDGNGDGKAEIRMQVVGYDDSLIQRAKDNNLMVIPYTLRAEEFFLAVDKHGAMISALNESKILLNMGVDALFIDNPDIGISARDEYLSHNKAEDKQ